MPDVFLSIDRARLVYIYILLRNTYRESKQAIYRVKYIGNETHTYVIMFMDTEYAYTY
jgi:hypothetical protein